MFVQNSVVCADALTIYGVTADALRGPTASAPTCLWHSFAYLWSDTARFYGPLLLLMQLLSAPSVDPSIVLQRIPNYLN